MNLEFQKYFFNNVRDKGISFKHVADECGVTPQHFYTWTSGSAVIPAKYIKKLSKATLVDPESVVQVIVNDYTTYLKKKARVP